jgi:hypothetical protein
MNLCKSLYSNDPSECADLQGVCEASSHPPSKCYLDYILMQSMWVHGAHVPHALGGAMSRASHAGGPGSIPGQDMSVSGPLD